MHLKIFRHPHTIRFGETDCAGIVYYPNFFDVYQQTEEEFWEAIGHPLPQWIEKWGLPIVHAEADFKRPVRFGDVLNIELTVARLGNSSLTFHFEASIVGQDHRCAIAEISHVLVDRATFEPTPLPNEMRTRLLEYRKS